MCWSPIQISFYLNTKLFYQRSVTRKTNKRTNEQTNISNISNTGAYFSWLSNLCLLSSQSETQHYHPNWQAAASATLPHHIGHMGHSIIDLQGSQPHSSCPAAPEVLLATLWPAERLPLNSSPLPQIFRLPLTTSSRPPPHKSPGKGPSQASIQIQYQQNSKNTKKGPKQDASVSLHILTYPT